MSQSSSVVTTEDRTYDDPTRFLLEIYDAKEQELIHTFNPFKREGNQPFTLTDIICSAGFFEVGGFSFTINDTKDKVFSDISKRTIKNEYVVLIKAGRTESDLKNYCRGFIENIVDTTNRKNNLLLQFSGRSKEILFNYTLTRFQKKAEVQGIGTLVPILSDDFRIKNLAVEAISSKDALLISNEKSLKERGNFDLSLLESQGLKEFMNAINFTGSFGGLMNVFANSAGGIFLADANGLVRLQVPRLEPSGITFKHYERKKQEPAEFTSYFYNALQRNTSSSTDQGFFQTVYLTIQGENIVTAASGETSNQSTSLARQDIIQQINLGSGGLPNLRLTLQKVGEGRGPAENALNIKGLRGAIVTNFIDPASGGHFPTDNIVATFEIPFDEIPESPSTISNINLSYRVNNINPSELLWLFVFKTGNEDDTINFFHDNDIETPTTTTLIRRSGTKRPPTLQPNFEDNNFNVGFAISQKGPVYRYAFSQPQTIEMAFRDGTSVSRFNPGRPKEIRINAPFIRDIKTAQEFADAILTYSAKLKVIFNEVTCDIPTQGIFPMKTAELIYPTFGITENNPLEVEINNVILEAHAGNPNNPFGAYDARVRFTAYPNPHQEIMDTELIGDLFDRSDICNNG